MSALTMQQTEFRWVFPRWQPPPGNGLVAAVSRAEATRGWVNSLLAIDADRQYVWAGLGGEPERQALEIVDRFGVAVASLAAAGADVRRVCLTLQVAGWLSRQRAAGDGGSRPVGSCLTCCSAPAPPPGAVRVPHLVSVRHGGWVKDAVVWELMDAACARQWLGLPHGWEFYESHVRRLLWLRAAVRTGRRLPTTPLARRLHQLIYACDADLSIEMVYRNDNLFRLLLEAWEEVPFRDSGGGDDAA